MFLFFVVVCFRKASATDSNRWCHQRHRLIIGCRSADGHHNHSPGAEDKKQKRRLLVRKHDVTPHAGLPESSSFILPVSPLSRSGSPSRKQPIRKRTDEIQVTVVCLDFHTVWPAGQPSMVMSVRKNIYQYTFLIIFITFVKWKFVASRQHCTVIQKNLFDFVMQNQKIC